MTLPPDSDNASRPPNAHGAPGTPISPNAPGTTYGAPSPGAPVAKITGAAVLGGLIGAGTALIWSQAREANLQFCPSPGMTCVAPAFLGILAGGLLIVLGSLLGFAVLNLRPLALTVPLATVITLAMVAAADAAVLGGDPPAWALILLLGAGYGVLAVSVVTTGAGRVAGGALLAAMLVASRIVPGIIHQGQEAEDQQDRLLALAFPLSLPAATGYKIASVYPSGDTLSVWMVKGNARRDQFGVYDTFAFTVAIGPVKDRYLALNLAACAHGSPPPAPSGPGSRPTASSGSRATAPVSAPACRRVGPQVWTVSGDGTSNVIARHGNLAVEASASGTAGVPLSALVQAATTLKPATPSAIVTLENSR